MTDLATWLIDRIAEDEAVARAAQQGTWCDTGPVLAGVIVVESYETVAVCNSSEWEGGEYSYPATAEEAANAAHIARHDPARVLAECAAKRRIVEQLWSYVARPDPTSSDPSGTQALWIIKTLALPYADHDGYDPSWGVQ